MYYFACPSCKNDDRFYRVERRRDRRDQSLEILIWLRTIVSLLLLSYERRRSVQCAHCGYVFAQPAIGHSPVAATALGFLYISLFAALVGFAVDYWPEVLEVAPGWAYVQLASAFVQRHAAGFTVALVVGLGTMAPLALGASIVGNWRHRRRVRLAFEHEPSAFPLQPAPQPVDRPTHCRSCGYDLKGNESGICPECGVAVQPSGSRGSGRAAPTGTDVVAGGDGGQPE